MVGNYNAANGHSAAEDPVIRDGTLGGVAPDVAELKAEHHHKEQISLNDEKDSSKGSETVKDDSHGYYHNFQPIANLGLADWRATERKLVRALDLTLMPTLWLTYLNNYLDRTNIAQAMLGGLDDDLGLSGQGYSTALSILTAGYMIGQLPSNMLLTRVRPSIYLPSVVVIWSIISACTALAKTPTQLFVIRFFLGMTEAPLFPGAVYLMSCWYTRKELALRTTILWSGLLIAQAVSGLLAAGIFAGLEGASGIRGWQWLFILEAATSTICGIIAFFTLPDYPHTSTGSQRWSMNHECRVLAEARMEADRVTGSVGRGGVFAGLKLAVTDIKLYLYVVLNTAGTCAYGFNFFFPILVDGLGIGGDNVISLLLTAPTYFTAAIVSLIVAWHSDRKKERGYHIACGMIAAAIGYIITISTDIVPARYAASFLYAPGAFSANALIYSWAVSSLGTTPEKRAAAGAIVNVTGHLGNIVSPYFFRAQERPTYRTAFILMLLFAALSFALAVTVKWYLKLQNKKIRKHADESGEVYNPYTL